MGAGRDAGGQGRGAIWQLGAVAGTLVGRQGGW